MRAEHTSINEYQGRDLLTQMLKIQSANKYKLIRTSAMSKTIICSQFNKGII